MSILSIKNSNSSDEECNWLEQLFLKGIAPPQDKTESNVGTSKDTNNIDTSPLKITTCNQRLDNKTTVSGTYQSEQNHDNWLGYLVSVFIDETVTQAKECCPGCNDQKNSPLLHAHQHSGLLEKLVMFHPLVRESMLSKMTTLVKNYAELFPDPEFYDEAGQKVLRTFGRDFLIQSSPTFIYYSHYLTPQCDDVIRTTPKMHVKPMTFKRVATKINKIKQPRKKKQKKSEIKRKSVI